jgi:hypothetical protein
VAHDAPCPICDADVPLSGDEEPGDDVSCAFCRSTLRVVEGDDEDDSVALEED